MNLSKEKQIYLQKNFTAAFTVTGKDRDFRFDVIKVVGLLCIILAHIGVSEVIFQLRNFDVPLIVLSSGALFSYSTERTPRSPIGYIGRRLLRLSVPSWLFLGLFFFPLTAVVRWFIGQPFPYSLTDVGMEFVFRSKIVGLWIVRVFMLVAMAAPFLLVLRHRMRTLAKFFLFLSATYIAYEIARAVIAYYAPPELYKLLKVTLFEAIPYGCLFGFGMTLGAISRRYVALLALFFFVAYLGLLWLHHDTGTVIWTQSYKYPPQIFYFSYAIAISLLLYLASGALNPGTGPITRLVVFMSSSMLWIYLWHWFFLGYWEILFPRTTSIPSWIFKNLTCRYLIVTALSVGIVYVQHLVVRALIDRSGIKSRLGNALDLAFLH